MDIYGFTDCDRFYSTTIWTYDISAQRHEDDIVSTKRSNI